MAQETAPALGAGGALAGPLAAILARGYRATAPAPAAPPCPVCGGSGWLARGWGQDEREGRVQLRRPCACAQERRRQAARARLRQDLGRLAGARFDQVRLPAGQAERASFRRCLEAARAFARAPAGFLVLQGPRGSGKTFLAACIASALVEAGGLPVYRYVPDLLDTLRATFDAGALDSLELAFGRLLRADVLFLDDLGAQKPTVWEREKLEQLVDYRYRQDPVAPLVVTSNLTERELDLAYPRLWSRLADRTLGVVRWNGAPDYRQLGEEQRLRLGKERD